MHNGDDLALVFSIRPVGRVQQKELTGGDCKIAAWHITLAALDNGQQTTRLAGAFSLCVFQRLVLPGHVV